MAVYVVALGGSVLYINNVLKTGTVSVTQESEKQDVPEVKPVKVSLSVELPGVSPKEYSLRKNTTDSVLDFLNSLRKETDFRYQKTSYLDHAEIDFVNGTYPSAEQKWALFFGEQDITQNFQDIYLEDEAKYYLRLVSN